jgi:hypothetical protein
VSSTGAAPGAASSGTSSSSSTGASSSSAAHAGIPKIALIGGAVAAGAVVAVVAARGGGGGGGSSPSGSSSPSGGSGGSGGSGSTVAGQWVGNAASGRGLIYQFGDSGVSCTFTYDITCNLTQSGGSVGGSMNYAGRTHTCTVPDAEAQPIINAALAGIPGDSGGFPINGSTNNAGGVTLAIGGINFAGSYTGSAMDLTGTFASNPGLAQFSMTMKLVR